MIELNKIKSKVIDLINSLIGTADIEDTDELINHLGLDSLDIIKIILDVESYFDISIRDSEFNYKGLTLIKFCELIQKNSVKK